jgi:NDP-sugar pyrophosphorylase family protein
MKAVVLAAGEGSRLRPLTFTRPKPMIPLGREPVIYQILQHLKREGFDEIIMIVGPMRDQIMSYLGDGSKLGQRITYAVKPEEFQSGTAGSLKLVEHLLDDTFLVAQSDTLSEIPLKEAMNFHQESGAHTTVVLTRVKDPTGFGVAVLDKSNAVVEFQEKPRPGEAKSDLVSTGFYVLEPEVLDYIETETFDFAMDLFPRLLKLRKRISGFASSAYWVDIGTLEGYLLGTKWALDNLVRAPPADMSFTSPSNTVLVAGDAQISRSALLSGPALVESGAVIEDDVKIGKYSVVKRNVRISRGTVVERSVILERAVIGSGCRISSSAVGQSAFLQDDIVANESIVGPGSMIGSGANLLEGSRIWPNVRIPDAQSVNGIVFVRLEESFRFSTSPGDYTGITASTAEGFIEALGKAPIESIEFHAKRRDFEKWVRNVLKSNELADEIEAIRRKAIMGEELRTSLISVTKRWAQAVSEQSPLTVSNE